MTMAQVFASLSPTQKSFLEFLAPVSSPAIVDLWGVNQQIDSSSLCLLSSLLPPLELRRKKKLWKMELKDSFYFWCKNI